MRVLLLHPEDDFNGPWRKQRWDWIVDLGRAPRSFYDERSGEFGCPVSSIYDFAVEIEDVQGWRERLAIGRGRVVDRFGLDWWDIVGLSLQEAIQEVLLAVRLAERIGGSCSLTASRSSLAGRAVELHLGVRMQTLQSGVDARLRNRVVRYRTALRNLSIDQMRQVARDKFDPHYRWRRKFARAVKPCGEPVVLLPTAYSNVTKTALNYARCLPEQKFLLAVARESAAAARVPENVQVVFLAGFAGESGDPGELRSLDDRWTGLERDLADHPEFRIPVELGLLRRGRAFLRQGISVRNAWDRVFRDFVVAGCLSADDTNSYTRIPLVLANRRGIPAVACHHGALDFRMAFKTHEFSTYLAQGEMERDYLERVCRVDPRRIRIGAGVAAPRRERIWSAGAPWIVFFTEPYEADSWRAEAIYREILPRLCAVARQAGKSVIVKVHPFETVAQRRKIVSSVLQKDDQRIVSLIDAPISNDLLRKTWCAVTIESTVASECAAVGIPAFLCAWLRHAFSGYAQHYARHGAGKLLESPEDLERLTDLIPEAAAQAGATTRLSQAITPETLEEVLLRPLVQKMRA